MMNCELEHLYLMALTRLLPYQSQVQQQLLNTMGSATALYEARHHLTEAMPDATPRLAELLAQMDNHLTQAAEELTFAEKKHIHVIGRDDADYPARLHDCPDAPIVLFYRGSADLNSRHMLSIVGTRQATDYGRGFCDRFLCDLSQLCPDTIVVSGLAYGIDITAHRQSLKYGLQTIGVLAHGLDQIYPRMHRQTAIEMLSQGGLLTEFMSGSQADKLNFVSRNRIVAGITDATLVVESASKGGSLITARIADDYGRDVLAVPGRVNDKSSAGCNQLIRDNRAALLESAQDFVEMVGWTTKKQEQKSIQGELFPQLSTEELAVCKALKCSDGKHLNQLTVETNLSAGYLSSLLFEMEMRGLIRHMNGGMYRLP